MQNWFWMIIFWGLGQAPFAQAFPDMIRHHYVNCNACHLSPTGGGLVNDYGRQMSKELLSTWGSDQEIQPLHGLIGLPDAESAVRLYLGGDIRALQTARRSPDLSAGRAFLMQAGLDFALQISKWTVFLTAGEARPANKSVLANGPRYFLQFAVNDTTFLRGGRFVSQFGLATAYHFLPTRDGFSPTSEMDGVEIVGNEEKWGYSFAIAQSDSGVPVSLRENRRIAHAHLTLWDRARVGTSLTDSEAAGVRQQRVSLHTLIGISKDLSYQTDFVWTRPQGIDSVTLSQFSIIDWETTKGFHIYFLQDYQRASAVENSLVDSWGGGARFYPRPHFEFDGLIRKKRVLAAANRYDDEMWALFHYYF